MHVSHNRYRFVRNIGRKVALATLTLALAGFATNSLAQSAAKNNRKLLQTVKPEYPETLKVAQIGGLVRLKATVQPNGTVTQVEVLGGNPILAEKAQAAVMKWKYAAAPTQTIEEIALSFSPH